LSTFASPVLAAALDFRCQSCAAARSSSMQVVDRFFRRAFWGCTALACGSRLTRGCCRIDREDRQFDRAGGDRKAENVLDYGKSLPALGDAPVTDLGPFLETLTAQAHPAGGWGYVAGAEIQIEP